MATMIPTMKLRWKQITSEEFDLKVPYLTVHLSGHFVLQQQFTESIPTNPDKSVFLAIG